MIVRTAIEHCILCGSLCSLWPAWHSNFLGSRSTQSKHKAHEESFCVFKSTNAPLPG